MKKFSILFAFVFLFLSHKVKSQEIDITQYLKEIEKGNAQEVLKILPDLKKGHPKDPSVLFLDAVLTTNGEQALEKYFTIYTQYPHSNYADASLYRIFSFYFSMGLYNKAKKYLEKLKSEYPHSPYIKYADRNIPQQELDEIVLGEKKSVIPKKTKKVKQAPKEKVVQSEHPQTFYTVQAGTFLNYENAQKLKERFVKKGWTSRIYPKEVGGSILNVVTVGKFSTRTEAENLLQTLKKEFGLTGRIISQSR